MHLGNLIFLSLTTLIISFNFGDAQDLERENVRDWQDRVIEERDYDFGEVQIGTKATHTFQLKNPGEEVMKIRSVDASCGCTIPKISQLEIPPGETCEISIALNTESFRGKKESTIYVVFDEPEGKQIQFKVAVSIRNLILEPESLSFRGIEVGQKGVGQLHVSRIGSPFWKIREITTSSEGLTASISKRVIKEQRVTFIVDCEYEGSETGSWTEQLTIFTNDSAEPKYSIPVQIEIISPITVSASLIDFEDSPPGSVKRFIVKSIEPSEISGLRSTVEGVDVQLKQKGLSAVHFVEVTRRTGDKIEGELRFQVDSIPEEMVLPIQGEVAR